MKRSSRSSQHMVMVEITPMIDVVFLLIIFFMTTAQFARVTRAEIDLPQEIGEQQEEAEEAGLVINLMKGGTIIVDAEVITADELEERIRRAIADQADPDPSRLKLLIRADRGADTAELNDLLVRLQRQGVAVARLATEVPRR